jgi:hypothetical protein
MNKDIAAGGKNNKNDINFATGCLAIGADRVQRNHRGWPVGMPDTQDRFTYLERLHKRGRRRSWRRGSNVTRPKRVHSPSVSCHRCRLGVLLIQTVKQLGRVKTSVVLGTHQPRNCKYR